MIATGNKNGDITVRNLNSQEGILINKHLEGLNNMNESGFGEVVLSHVDSQNQKIELTQVRFSVVKRHVLASAYKNGQVVIWDTQGIFNKQ